MRLIDADELLSIVRHMTVVDKSVMHRILIQMPTVDAVPVVRCNECQYFRTHDENVGFCVMSHCLKRINGYYNDGARMDGDHG